MSTNKQQNKLCAVFLLILLCSMHFSISNKIQLKTKLKRAFDSGSNFILEKTNWSAILRGSLRNIYGSSMNSQINLNDRIGNYDGFLFWEGTGFTQSCPNCSLNGPVLSCQCRTENGSLRDTSLDLNRRLENINGNFEFREAFLDYNQFRDGPKSIGNLAKDMFFEEVLGIDIKSEDQVVDKAREFAKRGGKLLNGSTTGKVLKAFSKNLKVVGYVMSILSVVNIINGVIDYLSDTKPMGGHFLIENTLQQPLRHVYEHDYQMNRWLYQWPKIINYGENPKIYFESENCALKHCSDTNAESDYVVNCNGRDVKFRIAVQNRNAVSIGWVDNDAYNPCYDISLNWGKWENYDVHDLFISGNVNFPYYSPSMYKLMTYSIKIIPHEKGSRFPVAYEDCNYRGAFTPLGGAEVTGDADLGPWAKKISSVRIPPGWAVIFFDDTKFGGERKTFTGDVPCMSNFNDRASSYILLFSDKMP